MFSVRILLYCEDEGLVSVFSFYICRRTRYMNVFSFTMFLYLEEEKQNECVFNYNFSVF